MDERELAGIDGGGFLAGQTLGGRIKCSYFQTCLRDGHASAICLINCEQKYRSCQHRPDWKQAELMGQVEEELARLMRMEIDELIEARLTRYAAEAESPELKDEIRLCLQKIGELAE